MAENSLACPVCKVPFASGKTASATIQACNTCGGVWLDNELSSRIVQTVDPEAVALADEAAAHAEKETAHGELACPACGVTMRVVTVDVANVDLDVCPEHGTWFDRNELETVTRAFQGQREAAGDEVRAQSEQTEAASALDASLLMLSEFEGFV